MECIRVENLRCLRKYEPVEIKPITLLVGANSSGKSTFLRIFPLLRQSVETRTLSGLLFNEGDANFGFFSDALSKDAEPQELNLEIGLTLRIGLHHGARHNQFLIEPMPVVCKLVYAKRRRDPRYPYLCAVHLVLGDMAQDKIRIDIDEDGVVTKFEVNDLKLTGELSKLRLRVVRGIVPTFIPVLETEQGVNISISDDGEQLGIFEKLLLAETRECFHGRTTNETRLAILRETKVGSPAKTLAFMQSMGASGSWQQYVQRNWKESSKKFRTVRNILLAKVTDKILASLNTHVSELARSIHYFAPVRATVERDYKSRDVPVNSVDPQGINVAMVLATLSNQAQLKFREWMSKNFGFEIFSKSVSDGARVALLMKEQNSGEEFNLADMGFGFSQMLPFLLQIWSLTENNALRNTRRPMVPINIKDRAFPPSLLVAIEQPELHLHPALQSQLVDMFVSTARLAQERNLPVRFMLETHSPTIIERLGQLVEAKQISSKDVQVLLFERRNEVGSSNAANVRRAEYDEEGVLQDWPFGFMSAPPRPPILPMNQKDPSPK